MAEMIIVRHVVNGTACMVPAGDVGAIGELISDLMCDGEGQGQVQVTLEVKEMRPEDIKEGFEGW